VFHCGLLVSEQPGHTSPVLLKTVFQQPLRF
jgi:hypothetical protein